MATLEDEIFEQLKGWEWKSVSELQRAIRKGRIRSGVRKSVKNPTADEASDSEMYRALRNLESRGTIEKRQRTTNATEWRRKNTDNRTDKVRPQGRVGSPIRELEPA